MEQPAQRAPWMDDELVAFRDAIRRFIDREFVPNEARWAEQGHIDREMWRKAGEIGLLCASIPEAYGGGGGNFAHEAVITLELADALVSGFGNGVHSGIVAHYLLRYGTEEQKQRWLPRMATGELVAAIAMSEPGAGSNLRGIRTRARRMGEHYVLDGAKTFITNGLLADLVFVVAKTDPDAGAKGISILVLETAQAEGFRRGRLLEKIGQKGQDTAELFFDEVRVPAENLLGGVAGQGMYQLMQQLPQERLIIALGAAASMARAVQLTVEYTQKRDVFGQPLWQMQNTRFKMAECATKATIARSFVDECMVLQLKGELSSEQAAMAKWWTTQANCEVIDECLQLHGGYGYMLEYPIARMYANARVSKIYGGSNEIMKEIVARGFD
ncbi:acyl-CoA dehydrogenase [Verticiella sediminum]|uniref:Acyl-[acyl-carrier-protein] dehydrogenase MbtN n=1 Tax=Verticiella sediminum TaxID=1247510 RepID=A0A556B079_9BURK|nr:acyl-CoA dehydrogenase family protein [Verticiella sediminum]TSH98581.1 acyl-CoA dehydrogenase [Verticiella sediminum]